MNHGHHAPHHWISVAVAFAALMLTITEANGQTSTGSAAVFEGRPALSGAQGGLGAQAGMPQGGLGVEGNDGVRGLNLRKPSGLEDMGKKRDDLVVLGAGETTTVNMKGEKDILRQPDGSIAKDQRSAVKKSKRAARSVAKQARTGVSTIDSTTK